MEIRNLLFALKRYSKCWLKNELEVSEFFEFRLWRRECTLEKSLEFIGWRKHIYALTILSPAQYRCTTENKLIFHDLCYSYGLDTPEILGIYDARVNISSRIRLVRNVDELRDLVEQRAAYDIVVKPVEGTRGQSVLSLTYNKSTRSFSRPDGCTLSAAAIEHALSTYAYRGANQSTFIVQPRVLPSSDTVDIISRYVPFSYRFLTIWDDCDGAHVTFAYGKAATGDRLADNIHSGGLALVLDRQGVCIGARSGDNWGELLASHPTTGARLHGWRCPEFARARNLALKAAKSFAFVRCVAWDILVGRDADGHDIVQLLEGNNPFNYDIQLVCDSGMWTTRFASEVERIAQSGSHRSPWW